MVSTMRIMSAIKGINVPMNTILVNRLITKMFAYSAIKISANNPLLYSTLKPDTSSDSPSAKSNGVRFVSARFVINQTVIKGINISEIQDKLCILVKSIVTAMIKALSKIKDILTSYEIVCATPRKAPSRAYLEFDLHPAKNVVYTFILDTHRKYKTLN
jgi:hypothetical protein